MAPRYRVAVLTNAFSKQLEPVAVYDGWGFVHVRDVKQRETQKGEGRCFTCLIHGVEYELWQAYDIDYWFTDKPLPRYEGY